LSEEPDPKNSLEGVHGLTKARRLLPTVICGVLALFACIVIKLFRPSEPVLSPDSIQILKEKARIPAAVRSIRPEYPYSVIPGGVYAPHELKHAVDTDSAVREHYSGFNTNRVQFVTLASDCYRYVSFRQGDQIYWTRRKLRIPKGEVLFTDGVNYARTRCGNRLAEQPNPAQLSLAEPPPEVLSPPPFRLGDGRTSVTTGATPGQELAADLPIEIGPIVFPNTIPDVVTGARPTSVSTAGLPDPYLSAWKPFFVALNNGAPRNPNALGGGGGSTGVTPPPPSIPIPVPEPDEALAVAAILCAIWFLVRPDVKTSSRHIK
jgi:hypothetical protein